MLWSIMYGLPSNQPFHRTRYRALARATRAGERQR
jgi:hypothetical protein